MRKAKGSSATERICSLLAVEEPYAVPARLMEVVMGPDRDVTYRAFLDVWADDIGRDWFHEFYEEENAERKKNKQDFTPDCLSRLASELVGYGDGVVYEPSAGTGGMLIARWDAERRRHHPLDYRPSMQWFVAEDMSDRAIPFLLFNLSIRGCNANVLHIDSLTRRCKAAYEVINVRDDMMAFSDVIELPRNDRCMQAFGIREWVDSWA
ncbi:MAG: N-6 DNA methylase [Bacteroidales bacterium]|nr:N-6 DNA methylase [Bacteroidales bacterium]